jgi:predicted dienelactone hydrolase
VTKLSWIILPVVPSYLAIALSVDEAGQTTSPMLDESVFFHAVVPLSHTQNVSVDPRTAYHQSDPVGYAVCSAVMLAKNHLSFAFHPTCMTCLFIQLLIVYSI